MLLAAERILFPDSAEPEPGWLEIAGDRIVATGTGAAPAAAEVLDGLVVPGYVDVHCHGGGGASFVTEDPAEARRAVATHRRLGVTTTVASLVTGALPDLARQVGSTTIYSHALRQLRWGIVGFIAAFALTIFLLTVSVILAFTGFLAMVACAIVVERAARRMGRAGIGEAGHALRAAGLRGYVNGAGRRTRDRFTSKDDDA